jgi:hypothetical protein
MKRTTAAVLMVVGATSVGLNIREHNTRYDNEKIWGRQMAIVERHISEPGVKAKKSEELRAALSKIEPGARQERCRFEKKFEALTVKNGDAKAAEADLQMRSFEPYAECKQGGVSDVFGTKWYQAAFPVMFVVGLAGMIGSFFRKNDGSS